MQYGRPYFLRRSGRLAQQSAQRHAWGMTNAHTDNALNGMKERLTHEFGDRSRADVAACFDNVTKDLLAGARILDFVPLLAYRLARGCVARLPAEEPQAA